MDALLHSLPNPLEVAVAVLVILAATVYAWKNALGPTWRWITDRVHKQDIQEKLDRFAANIDENERWWDILVPVAKFLEPNGKTLADHLNDNDEAHEKLFKGMDALNVKLDAALEPKPNGRRSYDPHE